MAGIRLQGPDRLKLAFLGTNGWYATPVGNTVCALIETPTRYLVLDAGDGLWRLDQHVRDPTKPIDLFLSHFHLDHTAGLHIQPKFRLMKNKLRIFGQPGTRRALETLVNNPYTASFATLRKQGFDVSIHELKEGDNQIDEYAVRTGALVHADPCWGFRFALENKKVLAYCTDTGPCENLISLARGADVLITECALAPGSAPAPAWPHLSPEMAAQAAKEAGVKALYLTHFAADKYPTLASRLTAQAAARKIFKESVAAADGMETEI